MTSLERFLGDFVTLGFVLVVLGVVASASFATLLALHHRKTLAQQEKYEKDLEKSGRRISPSSAPPPPAAAVDLDSQHSMDPYDAPPTPEERRLLLMLGWSEKNAPPPLTEEEIQSFRGGSLTLVGKAVGGQMC